MGLANLNMLVATIRLTAGTMATTKLVEKVRWDTSHVQRMHDALHKNMHQTHSVCGLPFI